MELIKWTIIILLVLVIGCATITTTIEDPEGNIWTVVSKKDSIVKLDNDGVKLEVNNQGKLGIIESIFGVLIMKTDIELSNKDRGD